MKKIASSLLLDQMLAETRELIVRATYLKGVDPGMLLSQPAQGKWSIIQIIEHLNSYDLYYLLAIEKSMQVNKPAVPYFKSGWLGDYFTRLMKPADNGTVATKFQSPKAHRPGKHLDAFPVLNAFLEQQQYLVELLERARLKNIGAIRTPISLTKLVRLKLGDTFRFLIAHKQRHFVQIENTLAAVKKLTGKYPAAPQED